MKKLVFALVAVFAASQVYAGDLINKDSKKYDLEIQSGGSTTHTSINGNTNQSGAAKKGYTIKIKGGSSIKVDFDGDVLIQNGQLKKK